MAYSTYYPHGALSGTSRGNGATSEWGYDGVGRLSGMLHRLAGTAHDAAWTLHPQSRQRDARACRTGLLRVARDDG